MNVARIAGIGVAVGVGALVLASCASEDDEPQAAPQETTAPPRPNPGSGGREPRPVREPAPNFNAVVHRAFDAYDRNGTGGIGPAELTRTTRTRITGERELVRQDSQFNYWRQAVGRRTDTLSIKDAVRAADQLGNKDGRAQWVELAKLAATFDRNDWGGLDRSEQTRFRAKFGADVVATQRAWTGYETWRTERYPDTPGNGQGNSPGDDHIPGNSPGDDPLPGHGQGNSPGDDPLPGHGQGNSPGDDNGPGWGNSPGDDNGPGHGPGNGPGDDHGPGPGSGSGNSPGDEPSWPTQPNPGNPGNPGGNGDSSDNGNPDLDDF